MLSSEKRSTHVTLRAHRFNIYSPRDLALFLNIRPHFLNDNLFSDRLCCGVAAPPGYLGPGELRSGFV